MSDRHTAEGIDAALAILSEAIAAEIWADVVRHDRPEDAEGGGRGTALPSGRPEGQRAKAGSVRSRSVKRGR